MIVKFFSDHPKGSLKVRVPTWDDYQGPSYDINQVPRAGDHIQTATGDQAVVRVVWVSPHDVRVYLREVASDVETSHPFATRSTGEG